jgi:GNAT superfamily N-acetyltransferase
MGVKMFELDVKQYDLVKSMFVEIPGCLWNIAVMEERNFGKIFVDNLLNPQTAFVDNPYPLYYFGGDFSKSFLDNTINHILSDIIHGNKEKVVFIFSSNQQWKDEIERCLQPYNSSNFGSYLTRRLYHLNEKAYIKLKETFKALLGEYTIELQCENRKITVKALFNGEEVCHCKDGGQGLGFMDFELFTHPNHRNKGLAQICCSKLIDYCIEHDIKPQWSCWSVNVPSCKLAVKLGFEITSETRANFAEINQQYLIV